MNVKLFQFITVNIGIVALVRLQEAVMNIANGGPPDSHDNIRLVKFRFRKVLASFMIVLKDKLLIACQYTIKKTPILIVDAASKHHRLSPLI